MTRIQATFIIAIVMFNNILADLCRHYFAALTAEHSNVITRKLKVEVRTLRAGQAGADLPLSASPQNTLSLGHSTATAAVWP